MRTKLKFRKRRHRKADMTMKEINIGQATAITSPDPLMLVCTTKEDGGLNMAPVSFFMYASFNPPMLAFAMGKASNSGENIRRTGKAVLAAPGISLKGAVMAWGSANGGKTGGASINRRKRYSDPGRFADRFCRVPFTDN